jgi:hypothetical protein
MPHTLSGFLCHAEILLGLFSKEKLTLKMPGIVANSSTLAVEAGRL